MRIQRHADLPPGLFLTAPKPDTFDDLVRDGRQPRRSLRNKVERLILRDRDGEAVRLLDEEMD
jgi:hypothetical protein